MLIKKKSSGQNVLRNLLLVCVLIIICSAVYGWFVFFENEKPIANLDSNNNYLGESGNISLQVEDDKTGIQSIKLSIIQNDKEKILIEKKYPRNGYYGNIGPTKENIDILFKAKKEGFKDGAAEIVAEVRDYSLRGFFSGNQTKVSRAVTIDTIPPKVRLVHAEKYISSGGSGIVIYQIPEHVVKHGVNFNGIFSKGFIIEKGPEDVYVAYIARYIYNSS